jgi:hypothetical protein
MSTLSFQLGLGLPAGAAVASAPAVPAPAPLYSTYAVWADGLGSEGSCPGLRNGPWHFLLAMKGRVRPTPSWMQAKSGGDLDTIHARRAAFNNQCVKIAHVGSQGHNDPIFAATDTAYDKWQRNVASAFAAHNGRARLFVVDLTLASGVSGEATHRTRIWDKQIAYVASLAATGPTQVLLHDTRGFDPLTMTPASDSNRVHMDERGGWWYGQSLFSLLDAHIVTATKDAILDDMAARSWRGANIYADTNLSGTAGTKTTAASGTGPTGDYATGQRITNRLATSAAVVCSKDTSPDPYDIQIVELSGTPAARETVVMDDTANVSLTGSKPGAFFMLMYGLDIDDGAGAAPDGLIQMGSTFMGNIGSTGDPSTGVTGPFDHAVDTIVMTAPAPCFGSDGPNTTNPVILNTRWEGALDGRIRYSRPQIFETELEEVGIPAYTGDDTIVGANLQARLTGTGVTGVDGGTISAATVGTVRCDPGRWENGVGNLPDGTPTGYTRANCYTVVLKKNGVVVSGAFASGWTYNMTGQVSNGDAITLEVTCTNSFGSSTKTIAYTVGA